MPVDLHPLDHIVNVHWETPAAEISLGFSLAKPFGIGDWVGYLTMTTSVVGLPSLSQTSFRVIADSFLPGERQEVSEDVTDTDGNTMRASAYLTTVGLFSGGIGYAFDPGIAENDLQLKITVTAPKVVDRNGELMDVPIDVYITGIDSMLGTDAFDQYNIIIAPSESFSATLVVQIEPPSMTLS